jgi:hypothetical protein
MILLDENIVSNQVQLLRAWKIRVRQVGEALRRTGLSDSALLAKIRRLGNVIFFSRDSDFYDPHLCHPKLCLVWLDVEQGETATFVRRTLRHPALRTWSARSACVVRVARVALLLWRRNAREAEVIVISWTS